MSLKQIIPSKRYCLLKIMPFFTFIELLTSLLLLYLQLILISYTRCLYGRIYKAMKELLYVLLNNYKPFSRKLSCGIRFNLDDFEKKIHLNVKNLLELIIINQGQWNDILTNNSKGKFSHNPIPFSFPSLPPLFTYMTKQTISPDTL